MHTEMMDHLSWVAYEERLRDPDAIVLLPVGALEQYGPQRPGCHRPACCRRRAARLRKKAG